MSNGTLSTTGMNVPQWSVVHEVLKRTWQALNGEATMPPTFPQDVVNALEDNIKIIYFDLLKLYDIATMEQGPQGQPGKDGQPGGITAPISGFFTMWVEPNGDLFVGVSEDSPITENNNPFRLDKTNGNFYFDFLDGI